MTRARKLRQRLSFYDPDSPFITFIVRACRRPRMLSLAINSILAQTDKDWEAIFIIDFHTRGVKYANAQFKLTPSFIRGHYVYPVDDDTFLPDHEFVEKLKAHVMEQLVPPDAIVVKSLRPQTPERELPTRWRDKNRFDIGRFNSGCIVPSCPTWTACISAWGQSTHDSRRYVEKILRDESFAISFADVVGLQTRQLGRGERFENCGTNWWAVVKQRYGIEAHKLGGRLTGRNDLED